MRFILALNRTKVILFALGCIVFYRACVRDSRFDDINSASCGELSPSDCKQVKAWSCDILREAGARRRKPAAQGLRTVSLDNADLAQLLYQKRCDSVKWDAPTCSQKVGSFFKNNLLLNTMFMTETLDLVFDAQDNSGNQPR